MNETNLLSGVLMRIDEATPNQIEGIGTRYPIAEFLREATMEMLRTAPLELLPLTDFSAGELADMGDGSGTVALPEGFVRLASFRMRGWLRPALRAIGTEGAAFARQLNRTTRGGIAKPVVALVRDAGGMKLRWFSLPPGWPRQVEAALCVVRMAPTDLPDILADPLCWLTASMVLSVTGEPQAAAKARERYDLSMGLLREDAFGHPVRE